MFDIGFPEMMLVSMVALLVIGPDRLPETIRTIMLWMGRIRKSFASIKSEIEQELGTDEIRQQLHNESIMKELKEAGQQIQDVIHSTDDTVRELKQASHDSVNFSSPIKTGTATPDAEQIDSESLNESESESESESPIPTSLISQDPPTTEQNSDRPNRSEKSD